MGNIGSASRALLIAIVCAVVGITHVGAAAAATSSESGSPEIPAQALLQPAELAQLLTAASGDKPLVLQVGSRVLYTEAHIVGAEYAGPAGQSAGLDALLARVAREPRERLIVIYCGCCPWGRCPNIRPAYRKLLAAGFTRVKALYLADDFGTDWVARGLPIAKGP